MERAIFLKVKLIIGHVGAFVQDRCPQDQLRVDGGICQVGPPKRGVIGREGWVEYVLDDIREGYASYCWRFNLQISTWIL